MSFLYALIANLVIATILILLILIFKKAENALTRWIDYLIALTVGLLLGIIFLHLLPEITSAGVVGVQLGVLILIGLWVFYIMEIWLHFHHCKDLSDKKANCLEHEHSILIRVGTLFHNMLHGLILFSAFSVDVKFWIGLTIAILLHSIPQNIANFIMNHRKAKSVIIAAAGGVLGILVLFPFKEFLLENEHKVLALVVGGLLYIALSDIFPGIKTKWERRYKLRYLLAILVGVGLMFVF